MGIQLQAASFTNQVSVSSFKGSENGEWGAVCLLFQNVQQFANPGKESEKKGKAGLLSSEKGCQRSETQAWLCK